ncbi:hypothetical protein D3C73_1212590 [compost metagenome]
MPMPKNNNSNQARPLRYGKVASLWLPGSLPAASNQAIKPTSAGKAATPNVSCQPKVLAPGAAKAAASAAPPMMPVVNSPISMPALCGWLRLMNAGIKAWMTAMPTPPNAAVAISAVPDVI